MGFTYKNVHNTTHKLGYITSKIPYIPPKRQYKHSVPGMDGSVIVEDGYDNMLLELKCEIGDNDLTARSTQAIGISEWLSGTPGLLIMDYRPDRAYQVVKEVQGISAAMEGVKESFTLSFECDPYTVSVVDPTLIFNSVVNNDVLSIPNDGNADAKPIIKLVGVANNLAIGNITIANLNGEIWIDCKEHLVYDPNSGDPINKSSESNGVYIHLSPGNNDITVTGTITSLDVVVDYRHTYLG